MKDECPGWVTYMTLAVVQTLLPILIVFLTSSGFAQSISMLALLLIEGITIAVCQHYKSVIIMVARVSKAAVFAIATLILLFLDLESWKAKTEKERYETLGNSFTFLVIALSAFELVLAVVLVMHFIKQIKEKAEYEAEDIQIPSEEAKRENPIASNFRKIGRGKIEQPEQNKLTLGGFMI